MSNIEWTQETWQVTSGCSKVSAGCAHCYAETMAKRLAGMARKDEAAGRVASLAGPRVKTDEARGRWWNKRGIEMTGNSQCPQNVEVLDRAMLAAMSALEAA